MHADLIPVLTLVAGKADFRFQIEYLLTRSYDGPDFCVFVGDGVDDIDNFIHLYDTTAQGQFKMDLGQHANENYQVVDREDLLFLREEFIRIWGNVKKPIYYPVLPGDPDFTQTIPQPPNLSFDLFGVQDVAFFFSAGSIAAQDGHRFSTWYDSGTLARNAYQPNQDHQLGYSQYASGTIPGVVSGPDRYMPFQYTGSLPQMMFGVVMPGSGVNPLSSPFSCRDSFYASGLPYASDVDRGVTFLGGTNVCNMIVAGNGNASRVWINGSLSDTGSYNNYRQGLPLIIGANLITVEYVVGTNSNGEKNFLIGNDPYDRNRGCTSPLLFAAGFPRLMGDAERTALEIGLSNVYEITLNTTSDVLITDEGDNILTDENDNTLIL